MQKQKPFLPNVAAKYDANVYIWHDKHLFYADKEWAKLFWPTIPVSEQLKICYKMFFAYVNELTLKPAYVYTLESDNHTTTYHIPTHKIGYRLLAVNDITEEDIRNAIQDEINMLERKHNGHKNKTYPTHV